MAVWKFSITKSWRSKALRNLIFHTNFKGRISRKWQANRKIRKYISTSCNREWGRVVFFATCWLYCAANGIFWMGVPWWLRLLHRNLMLTVPVKCVIKKADAIKVEHNEGRPPKRIIYPLTSWHSGICHFF